MPTEFTKYSGNIELGVPPQEDAYQIYGDDISQNDIQPRRERLKDVLKYGPQSALLGFVDTVGTSVGLLDDEQMEETLKSAYPGLAKFYGQHEEGAKLFGDMAGMFVPGTIAVKAVRGGGVLFNSINAGGKFNRLRGVFSSGKTYQQLMRGVHLRDSYLARRGLESINDVRRAQFASRAINTKVLDTIKETTAFELGVFATMNDSQTLYPDEFSTAEIIGLNAAFALPFVGGEYAFISRQLRASAQQAADFVSSGAIRNVRDPEGLMRELLERPGMRDIQMTAEARTANAQRSILEELEKKEVAGFKGEPVSYSNAKSQLNKQILVLEQSIAGSGQSGGKSLTEKMFQDSLFGNIVGVRNFTNRSTSTKAERQTILNAVRENEGILLGSYSFEHLPPTFKEIRGKFEQRATIGENLGKKLEQKVDELNQARAAEKDTTKLEAEVETLRAQADFINGTEIYVLEPTGDLINAKTRKPIYQDGKENIKKLPRTQSESAIYEVHTRGDPIFGTSEKVLGVSEDFHLIIPAEKELKVSGVNVTRVIPREELQGIVRNEDYSLILKDIGQDWHFKTGHRGKPVFRNLPREVQDEIDNWTGSSGSSKLRQWAADGDPRFNQVINAYRDAGLHKRLLEIADADGTITLYRGERKYKPGEAPSQDIVSFTSNPKVAEAFGGSGNLSNKGVIAKRVHVDDIVMVVGGLGDEFEYIVKNNRLREFGEQVTRKDWAALTLQERTAAYAGFQRAIDNYTPGAFGGPGRANIQIRPGDHYTRLDSFLTLYNKYGDDVFKDFNLQGGASIDDIKFAAIAGKYEDFVNLHQLMDSQKTGFIKIPDNQKLNWEDVRKMLNLPANREDGVSAVLEFFEELYQNDFKSLRDAFKSMEKFESAFAGSRIFPEMPVGAVPDERLTSPGEMMQWPKDREPVMVYKRPSSGAGYDQQYVREGIALMRADSMRHFENAKDEGAIFVANIWDELQKNKHIINEAIRVDSLTQAGIRGSGAVTQQAFAAGEQPALLAMHQLAINLDKRHREAVGQVFKTYQPIFNKLKNPANRADMESFNMFAHARRIGWDLEANAVKAAGPEGELFQFKLRDTKFNKERWQQLFGEPMPKDALMPGPTKPDPNTGFMKPSPVTITPLAYQTAEAVSNLGRHGVVNSNVIARAMSRSTRNIKEWWVPPKDFSKQNTAFLIDESGRLYTTVSGRSEAELTSKAEKIKGQSGKNLMYVSRQDVGRYFDLRDEAFERMYDFSDPMLQTGRAKGTSVAPAVVETGEANFNGMIETIERSYESILRRTRAAFFEPQIKQAFKLNQFAGLSDLSRKGQTVYQKYIAEIFDNPTLNPNDIIGKTYYGAESIYDDFVQAQFDKIMKRINPATLERVKAGRSDQRSFDALQKQLGDFNPFQDAIDYANRTLKVPFDPKLKPMLARLNNVTSLLTLRLMEVGHSILTMTSLAATMPAVVKSMNMTSTERALGETGMRQWKARIGAFGLPVSDDTAMFSPTRAITTGIHDMFDPEFREFLKFAEKRGFMKQQVAEIISTLTAPSEGYAAGIARKYTDMLSVLSDKSEILARGVSFSVGASIGKRVLGIQSNEILASFAHRFANEVIGDYSPNNKPRMFQGAVGMPLGLFMTFMWNYYQRMFSYVENKQLGALVTQYATQASVFGAQTVPGFDLYANSFMSNYDGSVNPVDALNNRLGPEATEWFLYGSISNLPKLFGGDEGIALYTRGDVNFRNIPTIFTMRDTPVVSMLMDGVGAMKETFRQIREREGFSPYQFSEVVQSYSTNRFLRSMASLATGHVTDRRGQVISSGPSIGDIIRGDVENWMPVAARLSGFRTLDEAKTVEAHYRIRSGELSRRYRLEALRDTIRSDIRAGEFDQDSMERAVTGYLKYGGSPEYVASYLAEQWLAAKVDKNSRLLMDLMGNERRSLDVQRLLNVMTPGDYE